MVSARPSKPVRSRRVKTAPAQLLSREAIDVGIAWDGARSTPDLGSFTFSRTHRADGTLSHYSCYLHSVNHSRVVSAYDSSLLLAFKRALSQW